MKDRHLIIAFLIEIKNSPAKLLPANRNIQHLTKFLFEHTYKGDKIDSILYVSI